MKANEKKCPRCAESIKKDALVCKHCGHEFSKEELARQAAEHKKNQMIGCGIGLVLLILVGTCTAITGGGTAPAIPEQPGPTAKADAIAFYKEAVEAVGGCDRAGGVVADAAKGGDPVAVYQAAERMEAACLSTSSDVRALTVPTSVGAKAHKSFTDAQATCETAYVTKWSSAGALKKALEESGSVRRLAEMREAADAVSAQSMACASGLVAAAMEVGATGKDLGIID